jgi:hypothetical protein
MESRNLASLRAVVLIYLRKRESSDTEIEAEYIPIKSIYDASTINDIVATPYGGYGSRINPVG